MPLQSKSQFYTGLLKNLPGAVNVPGQVAWTTDSKSLYVSDGTAFSRAAANNKVFSVAGVANLRTVIPAAGGTALVGDVVLDSVSSNTYMLTAYANKAWNASTAYAQGDTLIDANGNLQTVTTAGQSGLTEPTWQTTGTTPDNGVTWTESVGFSKISSSPSLVGYVKSINGRTPDLTGAVALGLINLDDTNIASPVTGEVLVYDTPSSKWINTPYTSVGVTSVGITMPAEFSVAGSPITNNNGTFTITKANQSANLVYAAPASGFAAQPSFRALVAADLPFATSGLIGAVQPDGTTITVNGSGVISAIAGSAGINQLTGDVTGGPGVGSVATTLAASGVTAGTYTSATITVDAKGRVTSASHTVTGTVTSVALATPTEFTVSGSPVTTTGTLTFTKSNQNANLVWAGPISGGATQPTFRSLVSADLPVATTTAFGAVHPDNTTISITGGVISAIAGTAGITQLTGDVTAGPGSGVQAATLANTTVTAGSYTFASITVDAKGRITSASSGTAGTGSVTSVALALPSSVFTISGSPVTTTGTLTGSFANQNANIVFAGPASGGATTPTFRAIVAADLPLGSASAFGAVKVDNVTITASAGVISVAGASLGITQLIGDINAGPGSGLQTATLVNSGVTAGTYNYATVTVDVKGRITSATNNTVGSVTSVALTVPAEFSVSGSPITSSGTLAITKASQSSNLVYAGPTSGTAAAPTFRSLVANDLPVATNSTAGAVIPDGSTTTVSGGVISAISGTAGINQLTGDVLAGPGVGSAAATLVTTGVTAGSYNNPSFTVDAKGRLTSASSNTQFGATGVTVDGGLTAPTTGVKGYIIIPYNATIVSWTIMANQSGSAVLDIKSASSYSGISSTTSITASAKPTLTSAQSAFGNTLTGWTTAITAGTLLEFDLTSVSSVTRLTLELTLQKT